MDKMNGLHIYGSGKEIPNNTGDPRAYCGWVLAGYEPNGRYECRIYRSYRDAVAAHMALPDGFRTLATEIIHP